MIHIPTLTTDRLILRAFRDDDLDAYAEMCADPQVMRYLGEGKTLSRADAWRQLAFFMGHWQLRGFGLWALEEKASGRFIGRAGLLQPEGVAGVRGRVDAGTRLVGKGIRDGGGARGAAVRVP